MDDIPWTFVLTMIKRFSYQHFNVHDRLQADEIHSQRDTGNVWVFGGCKSQFCNVKQIEKYDLILERVLLSLQRIFFLLLACPIFTARSVMMLGFGYWCCLVLFLLLLLLFVLLLLLLLI